MWHEEGNLERLFPDIYSLAHHQQITMAELWTPEGWRFVFRRQLNDWEIQRMADFIIKIEQFNGLKSGNDELWWQGGEKDSFQENEQSQSAT